jgi:hypothetical protein
MKSEKAKVRELVDAMRANGGYLIPDVPICYVLTEQAREYLAELERADALERLTGDDS